MAGTHAPAGIGLAASPSLLTTRVHALLREPSDSSKCARLSRACLSSGVVLLSLCLLPAVGLTLYWSTPLLSPSAGSDKSPAPRSLPARKSSQSHAHRSSQVESAPAQPEIGKPEALSSILASGSAKPLPAFAPSSTTGPPDNANSMDTPASTAHGSASAGAWNESPMPLATAPSWQKVATDAASAGVAAIGQAGGGSGGGETQDGQSGQQGNH
jgi:hypothetical protein